MRKPSWNAFNSFRFSFTDGETLSSTVHTFFFKEDIPSQNNVVSGNVQLSKKPQYSLNGMMSAAFVRGADGQIIW
jgi:hypothetical protein